MKYFGTDGIRSTFGESFLNEEFAFALGKALGKFINGNDKTGNKVLIGRDTRPTGKILLNAFQEGLKESGSEGVSVGIVPTPVLAFGVMDKMMAMGVMITASHNPVQDNGFKFFSCNGTKLNDEEEQVIEKMIHIKYDLPSFSDYKSIKITEKYIDYILKIFPHNLLENKKIVIDLSYGATQETTPLVLKKLGAVIHTLNLGSGVINDGVGSEYPKMLSQKVKELKADFGFAHDGDGDRVIFCNSTGEVISGDQILGLLALHEGKHGRLSNNKFVATIHSNSGLDASLEKHGIKLIRAEVGDKKVAQLMRDNNINLGGESSGHIVASNYFPTGDGLLSALLVARACYESNQSLDKLSKEIVLWPSFEGSFKIKEKIPIKICEDLNSQLEESKCFLADKGRILLRYSGTEPKIRLLVEAIEAVKAKKTFHRIAKIIEKTL